MEHSTGEVGFGDVGFGEPGLSVGDLAFLLPSPGEVMTMGLMGMGISRGDAGVGLVGESGVLECHSCVKHDMTEPRETNRALGDSGREENHSLHFKQCENTHHHTYVYPLKKSEFMASTAS